MSPRRSRPSGRRVGLIVPSVNATIEPDFAWVAPSDLSFHATRVTLHETTPEGLRAMNREVDGAARLIATLTPDVVAFACTSGTLIDGEAGLARQLDGIARIDHHRGVRRARRVARAREGEDGRKDPFEAALLASQHDENQ